jgi:transposase
MAILPSNRPGDLLGSVSLAIESTLGPGLRVRVATWEVTDMKLDAKSGEICVTVAWRDGADLQCPECEKCCRGYYRTPRRWRHLDTRQFQTILVADVPRIECHEHGMLQVRVPWAESASRFTALMEAVVIDWLRSMDRSAPSPSNCVSVGSR